MNCLTILKSHELGYMPDHNPAELQAIHKITNVDLEGEELEEKFYMDFSHKNLTSNGNSDIVDGRKKERSDE